MLTVYAAALGLYSARQSWRVAKRLSPPLLPSASYEVYALVATSWVVGQLVTQVL